VILVDDLRWYRAVAWHPARYQERWAHLVSDDSLAELHDFADLLGLRREWFQGDHYDIRPRQHALAQRLGAVAVDRRELVKRRVRAPSLL
jgi:hypothetical protein